MIPHSPTKDVVEEATRALAEANRAFQACVATTCRALAAVHAEPSATECFPLVDVALQNLDSLRVKVQALLLAQDTLVDLLEPERVARLRAGAPALREKIDALTQELFSQRDVLHVIKETREGPRGGAPN